MAKLTDAQRKVLARMEAGETLHRVTGISGTFFTFNRGGLVNGNTVQSLDRRGLIIAPARKLGQFRVECCITDAGRAALEQV